jgi:hypothetical protein
MEWKTCGNTGRNPRKPPEMTERGESQKAKSNRRYLPRDFDDARYIVLKINKLFSFGFLLDTPSARTYYAARKF